MVWPCAVQVNPDQSSIVANARQNAVHDLVDLYNELAFEVIDLWKVDKRSCQVIVLSSTACLNTDCRVGWGWKGGLSAHNAYAECLRRMQVLCSRIDIAWLKEAAKKAGADDGEIQNIFNLFECAIQFIVNSVLPRYVSRVTRLRTQLVVNVRKLIYSTSIEHCHLTSVVPDKLLGRDHSTSWCTTSARRRTRITRRTPAGDPSPWARPCTAWWTSGSLQRHPCGPSASCRAPRRRPWRATRALTSPGRGRAALVACVKAWGRRGLCDVCRLPDERTAQRADSYREV